MRTRCSRVREKRNTSDGDWPFTGSNFKVCVRIVKRLNRDEDVTWIKSASREAAEVMAGKGFCVKIRLELHAVRIDIVIREQA